MLCWSLLRKFLAVSIGAAVYISGAWVILAMDYSQSSSQVPLIVEFSPKTIEAANDSPQAQSPANCEYALAALDDAIIKVRQIKDSHLIIIAHSGAGERSSRINRIRLNLIEKSYMKRFPDVKYILAEGSRVKGLGLIEIYVGGRLLYALPIEKNEKSFCPYKNINDVL